MNIFKGFVIAFVLISFKSFACLNGESKQLKNGAYAYQDYDGINPQGHYFFKGDFQRLIIELDSLYKKTRDLDYLSDKGYLLIVLGKYDEALKLYLNIEKIKPNRYSTASNLGTLYELIGENQKAYNWIKKSIEINPKSHEGSEWLHLKILEAKVKNLKDVSGQFLINTNFGTSREPKTKLSQEEIDKLAHSIYFQVNERMSFIEPEDKIISILLFELGNLAELLGKNNSALETYRTARKYGYNDDLIVERMINSAQGEIDYYRDRAISYGSQLRYLRESKGNIYSNYISQIETSLIIVSIASIILLVAFIVFFLKWKKLKKLKTS
ncbi:tetratricopeptide repeat protein [Flavobacterium sp.]|uniref:tetratricopeptide repeat protein n=1 Tax=Flavobacterium sp. TaxID=239 RepID=UPI0031DDFE76